MYGAQGATSDQDQVRPLGSAHLDGGRRHAGATPLTTCWPPSHRQPSATGRFPRPVSDGCFVGGTRRLPGPKSAFNALLPTPIHGYSEETDDSKTELEFAFAGAGS